jgi:two-component system sensor kinase FixL
MIDSRSDAARILSALADASDDPIVVTDRDGVIVLWSRGAARLYGFSHDEVAGRPMTALMPEGHRADLVDVLRQLDGGERITSIETAGRTKDGHLVELMVSASPVCGEDGRVIGAAFVARDISRRRRDERSRRSTELRWRSIVESAVDGIVVIDASGRIEALNPAAERLFGYTEAEILGRNVSMLMPSPYREEHDGYLARYLREGQARIIGIGREVTGLRRDGTTFPLHLSVGEMVADGERKFTGIIHDLSARVELEQRLRTSEARWRAIIQSAVDAIVVIDGDGIVESFNPAAERMFGYSEADVVGRNVSMLMPEPYRSEHDGYLARYLREGSARIIGIGREVTARRRDGTTFPVHLSVGEMSDGGERRFTGILHDLTVRARMEQQLREQTALARLGEMAAVIAHEVKNPLAGVRGAIQVIGGRLSQGSQDAAIIDEIVKRIDALNDLMKNLLLFARTPEPKLAPVAIDSLLRSTADLLRADPALREVEVALHGNAPVILADHDLLQIVFLNLLVNAAHAMQSRGTISVSLASADGGCEIAVVDHGPGIPRDVREKIFTPFFTTKSRGSGLGLPTAKRLVEAHRGQIRVESPDEGGTRVVVQLPGAVQSDV